MADEKTEKEQAAVQVCLNAARDALRNVEAERDELRRKLAEVEYHSEKKSAAVSMARGRAGRWKQRAEAAERRLAVVERERDAARAGERYMQQQIDNASERLERAEAAERRLAADVEAREQLREAVDVARRFIEGVARERVDEGQNNAAIRVLCYIDDCPALRAAEAPAPAQAPEPCRAEYLDCEGMIDRCNFAAGHDGRHGDPEPAAYDHEAEMRARADLVPVQRKGKFAEPAARRDESVPPPGFEWDDPGGVSRSNARFSLRAAWDRYDREHGYAPAAPRPEPAAGRDESVPPPGWRYSACRWEGRDAFQLVRNDEHERDDGKLALSDSDILYSDELPAATRALWRTYDREHGYAPVAPRLDRFRALAERWETASMDVPARITTRAKMFEGCARELLAVVAEVERG